MKESLGNGVSGALLGAGVSLGKGEITSEEVEGSFGDGGAGDFLDEGGVAVEGVGVPLMNGIVGDSLGETGALAGGEEAILGGGGGGAPLGDGRVEGYFLVSNSLGS